jgi:hypothetical protein
MSIPGRGWAQEPPTPQASDAAPSSRARVEEQVLVLKNASAQETRLLLRSLFADGSPSERSGSGNSLVLEEKSGLNRKPFDDQGVPSFQKSAPSLRVVVEPQRNAVRVTGRKETLALVRSVVEALDRSPEGTAVVKRYTLLHARAAPASKILNELWGVGPLPRPAAFSGRPMTSPEAAPAALPLQAVPDPETNGLVVISRLGSLDEVDAFVQGLDQDPGKTWVQRTYQLKHRDPVILMETLKSLFDPGLGSDGERSRPERVGDPGSLPLKTASDLEKNPQFEEPPSDRRGRLLMSADPLSGILRVGAPLDLILVIDAMVRQWDIDSFPRPYLVIHHSRDSSVEPQLPALSRTLREAKDTRGRGGSGNGRAWNAHSH